MKYVVASLCMSLVVLLSIAALLIYTQESETTGEISDNADGDAAMLHTIAEGETAWDRDLLRLEYVTNDPQLSHHLCPQMEGAEAKELCLRVQGRTHLWPEEFRKERRHGRKK
jgi:hypothetical protein